MNTSFQRTSASDEWYTPKELVGCLGHFDLDPCEPMEPLWRLADRGYNRETDGLAHEWGGRVWLNPPYSQPLMDRFCERLAEHGDGILLVFARPGNRLWQEVLLPRCDGILFLRRRVRFYMPDGTQGGSPGCDSCLVAFGKRNVEALRNSGLDGYLVERSDAWGHV